MRPWRTERQDGGSEKSCSKTYKSKPKSSGVQAQQRRRACSFGRRQQTKVACRRAGEARRSGLVQELLISTMPSQPSRRAVGTFLVSVVRVLYCVVGVEMQVHGTRCCRLGGLRGVSVRLYCSRTAKLGVQVRSVRKALVFPLKAAVALLTGKRTGET